MGGFSSITADPLGTVLNADNVSFDGTTRDGVVTTNGQLLIGSTSTPHIRVGSITSPMGTLAIGYSAPNLTLDLAGGATVVETLTGNSGGAIAPLAGNIGTVGTGSITIVGSGNSLTTQLTGLTSNSILFGQGTETIGLVTASNNGVLITSNTNVPSLLANSGTPGFVLTANAGAPPSWQTAAAGGIVTINGGTGSVTGTTVTVTGTDGAITTCAATTLTIKLRQVGTLNCILGELSCGAAAIAGIKNCGIGTQIFNSLTTGSYNIGMGDSCYGSLQNGSNNCIFGVEGCLYLVSGTYNVGMGINVLKNMTTGSYNVCLGTSSGSGYTGAEGSNIVLGTNNLGSAGESNTLRIGAATGAGVGSLNRAFIAGINGIANTNPAFVTISTVTDQIGVIATANSATMVTTSAGVPVMTSSMTHGQVVIGSTGATPVAATLTAGTGVSITNGAGSITINATGGGIVWSVITIDQTAVINNGYICNKVGLLTLTLPATAAIGDTIRVTGINTAAGWRIAQNANQQIFFGTSSTTVGVGGSLDSVAIRDTVEMVCVVAGASTVYNVISSIGNITVI